ncbi:HAMP domain-containing sensor histidine kinase [Nocardia huaxiensis]|uniref:HAMP domain-containing sensor histidine kinase n=1 Tax=Nocardia huaxiensis TaxID=2755382 RepID=UPI001E55A69B|nr:HAMP domain-containing sensor histidine kinase [Nocardia huaxiensis]UFS95644.1 HAMP domain-containing histidine kinase [Nocardia huaxiensis]
MTPPTGSSASGRATPSSRRWLRRPVSLRTRVALASALTAAIVVTAMGAVLFAVAKPDAEKQAGTVVSALAIRHPDGSVENGTPAVPALPGDPTGPITIHRSPDRSSTTTEQGSPGGATPAPDSHWPPEAAMPALELGPADFARTLPVDAGKTVVVAVPRSVVAESTTQQRTRIVAIGVAAVALAAVLGWCFANRAVAPLRRLTAATAGLGDGLVLESRSGPGASETAELGAAMNTMLGRIADERRHTGEALVTARDFAATAAHELRTPLTSMRTDLQVLRSMPLSESERAGIIDEILVTQGTVETTLAALERLAVGDLTTESDWEDVDLGELVDQVVDDARRAHPQVTITDTAVDPIRLRGLTAGLRSVIDNALTNAVRHGAATRIDLAAHRDGDTVTLTVDDNGTGIPESERARVFDRFHRASAAPGSGLGLALVAQQARLHGGFARIDESPLGGARLTFTLSVTPVR